MAAGDAVFTEVPDSRLLQAPSSAAPTTDSFAAIIERVEATIHAPGFTENVLTGLLLLFALVVAIDGRRVAAGLAAFGRAVISGLIRVARVIVDFADSPPPPPQRRIRTFEPLLRIAEPVPQRTWPAMSIADHDCAMPAPQFRAAPQPAPARTAPMPALAAAEPQVPTLARYSFYTLNQWGVVDCRTEHSLATDAAALAHASRIAGNGSTEVWRDGHCLGTISGDGATPDYRRREYV